MIEFILRTKYVYYLHEDMIYKTTTYKTTSGFRIQSQYLDWDI